MWQGRITTGTIPMFMVNRLTQARNKGKRKSSTYYKSALAIIASQTEWFNFSGNTCRPAYYSRTISLKKGAKSALIEIQTDHDQYFQLPITWTFRNKARYRGHHLSSGTRLWKPMGNATAASMTGKMAWSAGLDAQVVILIISYTNGHF